MSDVLGSRSGESDPHGKMDRQVTFSLPEELLTAVDALAFIAGVPRSEYLRKLIFDRLYGEVHQMRSRYAKGRSDAIPTIHQEPHEDGRR